MSRARDNPQLQRRVRVANNLCPICWMPLGIEKALNPAVRSVDAWRVVQIAFRGKPGFSLMNPDNGSETMRPVLVFGLSDRVPHANENAPNYDRCHYVHFKQFGNQLEVKNLWFAENIDNVTDIKMGVLDPKVNWNVFLSLVRESRGIFYKAIGAYDANGTVFDATTGPLSQYIATLQHMPCNWNAINVLVVKMFRFFAGCKDCNQKMSFHAVMGVLFKLAFPNIAVPVAAPPPVVGGLRGGRRRQSAADPAMPDLKFSPEEMVHYVMLSGVLSDAEVNPNTGKFQVVNPERKQTWPLRYIMMWCALQILSGMWMIRATDQQIRHHRTYIYHGVMDFYASLWFFAMHCLRMPSGAGYRFDANPIKSDTETLAQKLTQTTTGDVPVLEFEEFHFYYTSVYPIFLRRVAAVPVGIEGSQLNLSTVLFGQLITDFNFTTRDNVVSALRDIYIRMFTAWSSHVVHISDMIYANFTDNGNPASREITDFFAAPADIIRMRSERDVLPLTVQGFSEEMGRRWFWFHFKHITFNRIALECKQYEAFLRQDNAGAQREVPSVMASIRMWRQWYVYFGQTVRQL